MWILAFIFFLMDVAQHHGDAGEMIRFAAERAFYYVVVVIVMTIAVEIVYRWRGRAS